ncbi:MAG TPA: ABC transporter ATP-binding protein [Caldilineaceae bacterium]|nr:ABC transporter ATP-binding protein [Caldilineaceae bacterium]
MAPLLEVHHLVKQYVAPGTLLGKRGKLVRAVADVSFAVEQGETLGLVGESGSGKSTLAKCLMFLEAPTSGAIRFNGEQVTAEMALRLRRQAQLIFQDPYSSLPPRMRVGDILADPLLIHGLADRRGASERVRRLLADVGLGAEVLRRYPHQFSGGQRQRISIARALAVAPSLVIADEAVSALDVSVQAQVLNLLKELQTQYGLTYLFISHDLGVVRYMSHRIAVMHLGELVEIGAAADVYHRPLHPYTRVLLSAVPSLDRASWRPIRLRGEPPNPANPPPGCKFHTRCPLAQARCRVEAPLLQEWLPGRQVACHYALDEFPAEPGG